MKRDGNPWQGSSSELFSSLSSYSFIYLSLPFTNNYKKCQNLSKYKRSGNVTTILGRGAFLNFVAFCQVMVIDLSLPFFCYKISKYKIVKIWMSGNEIKPMKINQYIYKFDYKYVNKNNQETWRQSLGRELFSTAGFEALGIGRWALHTWWWWWWWWLWLLWWSSSWCR